MSDQDIVLRLVVALLMGGAIGFEKRIDYGAIGTVTNLAARLCAEAPGGEIYVSQQVHAEIDGVYVTESLGELALRGLSAPQLVYRLDTARLRASFTSNLNSRPSPGRSPSYQATASSNSRRAADLKMTGRLISSRSVY